MQCNVLTQLKHNGDLYVPGSLADLPDDVAEQLIKDGVVEAYDPAAHKQPELPEATEPDNRTPEPETPVEDESEGNKPLEQMTGAELKKEAEERGLSTSGNKEALLARILDHDQQPVPASNEDEDNGDDL